MQRTRRLTGLGLTTLALMACAGADGEDGERGPRGYRGTPGAPAEPPDISVARASRSECPYGGSVLTLDNTEVVICSGADGENGTDGVDGVDAPEPETGPFGVTRSVTCRTYVDSDETEFVTYRAIEFTDGSAFVFGALSIAEQQVSSSDFLAPGTNPTGFLTMTLDVEGEPDGGYWTLELDRDALVLIVGYNDSSDALLWTINPNRNGCEVE